MSIMDAPKCDGVAKSTGKPCQKRAVHGTGKCENHGATLANIAAAGRRRLLQADLARTLAEVGYEPMTDPWQALEELGGQAVAVRDWAVGKASEAEGALAAAQAEGDAKAVAATVLGLESLAKVWLDWFKEAARIAEALAKLNLDERRVRVDEVRAQLVTSGLEAYRLAADVDDEAHNRGLEAMAAALGFQGQIAA